MGCCAYIVGVILIIDDIVVVVALARHRVDALGADVVWLLLHPCSCAGATAIGEGGRLSHRLPERRDGQRRGDLSRTESGAETDWFAARLRIVLHE